VNITHNKALGDSSAPTTVGQNSQLQVSSVSGDIAEPLILNGPGIANDGALLNVAGNNTWVGTIDLGTDGLFGVNAGALEVKGQIRDLGAGHSVTKIGVGQLIFSAANAYHGTTTVNNGILTIRNAQALGTADGTAATGTLVNNNPVSGTGTLQLEDPSGAGFTVLDELLTLNGPGFNGLGALNNLLGNNHWAGHGILGSAAPGTDVQIGVAANTATPPNRNTDLFIDSQINDPSRPGTMMTKILPGRLILTNKNLYTGPTVVSAGVLNI